MRLWASNPGFPTLAVLSVLMATAPAAIGQNSETDKEIAQQLGADPTRYRKAITDFQKAVRSHDAQAAAALVDYPIGVAIGGRRKIVKDAKAFVAQYDSIMTPDIAAAVQNQKYDDLGVNYKGVWFGDGEVWLNGLCHDEACKSYDVKVVTIQPRSEDSPPPPPEQVAQAELVQPLKQFKNWAVGCDNLRGCIAVGMMDDEDVGAYVRIRRGGEAADEPGVAIRIDANRETRKPGLKLTLDGVDFAPESFSVEPDGEFVAATVTGKPAADFALKLRAAKVLKVGVLEGTKAVAEEEIPLNGSAAALLYLDDTQKRVGTETALVAKGDKPASSIPPAPPIPVIAVQKIDEIGGPLPKLPQGIKRPKDANCSTAEDMLFKLSPKQMLWGVCAQQAAYNYDYEFWIVSDGKPERAVFDLPGRKPDSEAGALVSPSLSEDGFVLNALYESRGLGDCGDSADWVWNGEAFKLISYREMTECRGVLPDDWPVLFAAERK